MMVVVQGTKEFSDYNVFLRAMAVALTNLHEDDPYFYVYTLGGKNINEFVFEFCNLSERNMKARKKKIKYYTVPNSWVEENMHEINYFAYLYTPGQTISKIAQTAQNAGVELGLFQY